ncbi:MAG: hypothetical protein HGB29_04220 [Chlorobiaceae bacterium]|nr:hypothetical protein [Chlorobiaceae bacterium]NTW74049.1 hypothetical protein [Chlorobiaceae bacterium]
MKKSAKLMALAVALFAGFGASTAHAEGFKVGADVVSSYVWRGADYGDSPAIQPTLSYTFGNGIALGAWGSYAISENNGDRYKEIDLSVSLPIGPFTFSVTDYNTVPEGAESFDFTDDSANVIEISTAYAAGNFSLLAAINVGGNSGAVTDVSNTKGVENAKYCEASYKFYDKDGFSAKGIVGLGDEDYYGDKYGIEENDTIAVVNTGISVSKDRYTASYIYNPDTEKSHLVFMASF